MKVKTEEVRKMSSLERKTRLTELRKKLFEARSESAMGGTLADPMKIRMLRRSISRLMTIMHENNEI
jgi:ribosomal protein L29